MRCMCKCMSKENSVHGSNCISQKTNSVPKGALFFLQSYGKAGKLKEEIVWEG